MIVDTNFQKWVESLSQNYKKAQIKAAIHVNSELIKYYYELGKEIFNTSFKASYGSRFYDLLSIEFKKALPNVKGLNYQNIRYAKKFYTCIKTFSHNLWENWQRFLEDTIESLLINAKH